MTYATVTVNPKGQITIPPSIREQWHLRSGDELAVLIQDDQLIVKRTQCHIEDAFGLCKAHVSVSLADMEHAIRAGAQQDDRN